MRERRQRAELEAKMAQLEQAIMDAKAEMDAAAAAIIITVSNTPSTSI